MKKRRRRFLKTNLSEVGAGGSEKPIQENQNGYTYRLRATEKGVLRMGSRTGRGESRRGESWTIFKKAGPGGRLSAREQKVDVICEHKERSVDVNQRR